MGYGRSRQRSGRPPTVVQVAVTSLAALVPLLVAGCSGGSGGSLPALTAEPSRTGSLELPSSLPSRTRGSSTATREASTPPRSVESVDVSTDAQEPTKASQADPAGAQTDADDSSTGWALWALLALVVVGVAVAGWQHRQSRRREQQSSFDLAVSESRWLGRELLPVLLVGSRDERRGAWNVSRPRVVALEERLAQLATPGSETIGSLNAQQLETSVIGVRSALDDESRTSGAEEAAEALGGVKQAARALDQVLATLLPSAAAPH
jgi:hypothetical protein